MFMALTQVFTSDINWWRERRLYTGGLIKNLHLPTNCKLDIVIFSVLFLFYSVCLTTLLYFFKRKHSRNNENLCIHLAVHETWDTLGWIVTLFYHYSEKQSVFQSFSSFHQQCTTLFLARNTLTCAFNQSVINYRDVTYFTLTCHIG